MFDAMRPQNDVDSTGDVPRAGNFRFCGLGRRYLRGMGTSTTSEESQNTDYSERCSLGSDGSAYKRSSSCTSASWPAVKILPKADRSIASQLARNMSSASKSGFVSFTTSSCIGLNVAGIVQRGSIRPFGG